jgi:hypothetical protein
MEERKTAAAHHVPGQIVNPSPLSAHMLRAGFARDRFPAPEGPLYDVVVVGGGVSGLSAAWKLRRSGIDNILLLEMAEKLGGTSLSGERAGSAFPWGAHYINIPPQEADCVHEVLGDLGIIEGYDARGWPRIADGTLLRWPHERLHIDGEWRGGLDPLEGGTASEREQGLRFRDEMLRWTLYRGRDGRRAFAMPLLYSSSDPQVRSLDRMSMAEYMQRHDFDSPRLNWLVDYACRDDYGSLAKQTSAWAGIHYFACRYYDYRLYDEYPTHTLTWPEGNARLTNGLAAALEREQLRRGTLLLRIEEHGAEMHLGTYEIESQRFVSIRSRAVVYAGKLHTVPFVVGDMPAQQKRVFASLEYSPWLVAAIHLKKSRSRGQGVWDNVLYGSSSLGYVVADHQSSTLNRGNTLVYYLPFVEDIDGARRQLLERDHAYWVDFILRDLGRVEKNLASDVERIDIYRWGHGMLRPRPGSLWGDEALWRRRACGAIFFASCDSTGLPLFEEALFAGLAAAEQAMQHLGHVYISSLGGWARG